MGLPRHAIVRACHGMPQGTPWRARTIRLLSPRHPVLLSLKIPIDPEREAHAVLAFASGASWGNEVLRAQVRSADARVLGVRLRLFYDGAVSRLRRLVVSDLWFFVTCRERACRWNASKLPRTTMTEPLLAVQEERHRQECLCHKSV
jgi:hypothetical protein